MPLPYGAAKLQNDSTEKKHHRTIEISLDKHILEPTNWIYQNDLFMVGFLGAENEVRSLYLEIKTTQYLQRLRQSFQNMSDCISFTPTLFTEIQTWYQIQANYKNLVNLPKTLLRCYSTGRLTRSDLKMCFSNHVLWKQDRFFKRGAQ